MLVAESKDYDLFGDPVVRDVYIREKFCIPPTSILDSSKSTWQNRKEQWTSLASRQRYNIDYPSPFKDINKVNPVLCEVLLDWFCPKQGNVLDPFCRNDVSGIVANYQFYKYTGLDMTRTQASINMGSTECLVPDRKPSWIVEPAIDTLNGGIKTKFDLVLTFLENGELHKNNFSAVVHRAVARLKKDRFAVFVTKDWYDTQGNYISYLEVITRVLRRNASLHNNIIYLPDTQYSNNKFYNRIITPDHYNIYVFYKGDKSKINSIFTKTK